MKPLTLKQRRRGLPLEQSDNPGKCVITSRPATVEAILRQALDKLLRRRIDRSAKF